MSDPFSRQSALRPEMAARPTWTHTPDAQIERWLPVVLRWTSRLGGPRVDPEDAAHDVMLVLLRRLDFLQDEVQSSAWVFGVTRRVLAQHRRRAWFRRWVLGLAVDGRDERPDPYERCAEGELVQLVQESLEALPEAQREVFVLCEVEGRPDAEVAGLLGIPKGTVKSRLRIARQQLSRLEPLLRESTKAIALIPSGAGHD